MSTKILSALQFDCDQTHGREYANKAPVLITEGGEPSHVLLNFEAFRKVSPADAERMAQEAKNPEPVPFRSLFDAIAMKGGEDIEFNPPRLDIQLRVPDFTD